MLNFPVNVQALYVDQPLGAFYVAVLPARLLLDVCHSDVLSATLVPGKDTYTLDGTQRIVNQSRLAQIKDYINRTDSSFPNSIILAANFRQEDGLLEDDPSNAVEDDLSPDLVQGVAPGPIVDRRWSATTPVDGVCTLSIPTPAKLAAIIDGQHRLFGFVGANPEKLDMNLICSIFLDLPKPFQAQLFATINSTQKRVDKSLTYELFGYNIEEEQEELWSPDKLAVFLSRRLTTDSNSPLKGKIVIAPRRDPALESMAQNALWKVSTAVVVEGIMRLFTSNPKKDTALLLGGKRKKRQELRSLRADKSPLRDSYLAGQDAVIYTMVLNFVVVCDRIFWEGAPPQSFITKTVGIQALFDILRKLSAEALATKDISAEFFDAKLSPAKSIDFASAVFRNASGSGRTAIRKALESAMGL